jgi:hypothetical protein
MVDLAHWDFALEFSGIQIAALVAGLDPSKAGAFAERVNPILRRLDEAYREGLRECWDRHSTSTTRTAQERTGSDLRGTFVSVIEDMARKGADEFLIQHEIEGLWDRFDEEVFSRAEVIRWLKCNGMKSVYQFDLQTAPARANEVPLSRREEATYLTIVGALLELVRNPRPGRDSDAAVIRELIENYGDKPGVSKTTLEAKFANARRRLNST